MKRAVVAITLALMANAAWGAVEWNENFEYSTGNLTTVGSPEWVSYSGTSNYIQVVTGSLTYGGYPSSGIGNQITVTNGSAEDAYRAFTSFSPPASVYTAFLINVANTTSLLANSSTTGDYFASYLPATSTTLLFGRVSIRLGTVANTYQIGLRATSSNAAAAWNTTDLDIGTTYLIVLKYKSVTGNANDTAYVWINPATGGSEPAYDLIQASALATDPATVARLAIRQGTNTPNAAIDGIRVGTAWADVCPPTSTPFISVNPSSLDFGTLLVNDTLELSYSVSGDNLTAGVTVTAPSPEFAVSLTSGSGFASSVTIPRQGDSIPPTTVYARLIPAGEGARSGNITHASAGAATQNVAVGGYGTKISILGALASFGGVEVGQTSAEQTYTYRCSGLLGGEDLIVTAPANFQVSWQTGTGFATTISRMVPAGGRLPLDTVYVRFAPASTGTKSDSISHASSGATTRYQQVHGRGVASEPTIPAGDITFSNIGDVDMRVNWTRGNGSGCMVVARCENPIASVPLDGYYYAAADSFGKGGSPGYGHYVVYKGTGTQVTVRKLYGITTYHYAVFEYNGTDSCENYLTSSYPAAFQITGSMSGTISLTTLGSAYTQDFSTLDTAATALPAGWNYREEGSQANYRYAGGNGNSNTGNIYSFGAVPEQAFGGLLTSSLEPTISAVFTNNTGGTLTAVDIAYQGELWRLGLQRWDSLKFELSTTPGTWVAYPQLNFITPDTHGAYGPRDGNNWMYRRHLGASISGLSIANGGEFRIRWLDANAVSYDDGMAVDDFALIPFNGSSLPRIIGTTPYDTATGVAVNTAVRIGFSEPINTSSLAYACSPDPGGWSASWNAAGDTVTLTHASFGYWTDYTFTVTQARDLEGFDLVAGGTPNPLHFRTAVNPAAPPMYITMLNIGQGDCIVIRSPTGRRVLVDAGDGGDDVQITNFIKDSIDIGANTRFLDYAFLSHYHDDHGGGLDEVIARLDSLRVGAYDRGDSNTSGNSTYGNYIDSLAAQGWSAKRHAVTVGQTFDLGGGASIQVITYDGKTLSGDRVYPGSTDENNHSMGLLLNYADKFKMVMCGDISKATERILSPDLGGRISVLKANHHGSDDANGLKWVTDLNPMVTLIPVGDGNSYGHVHLAARDSLLADPKSGKAAGDSNRLYRTELGSGAPLVAGRDFAMYQNIHIEVTPANPSYCFTVMNDGSTYPHIGGAMAVTLSQFAAAAADGGVMLAWRTESETDCYSWDIERSTEREGVFRTVGTVAGHGTTYDPHQYRYDDRSLPGDGVYWYRLAEVDLAGARTYHGPVRVLYNGSGVARFQAEPAYPNPATDRVSIDFQLPLPGRVSLGVYNVMGQRVRSLVDGDQAAGRFSVAWDGRDGGGRRVAGGVYLYRLEYRDAAGVLGRQAAVRKLVLAR